VLLEKQNLVIVPVVNFGTFQMKHFDVGTACKSGSHSVSAPSSPC